MILLLTITIAYTVAGMNILEMFYNDIFAYNYIDDLGW